MLDDKKLTAVPVRSRVTSGEEYEMNDLVERSGLTKKQAKTLIRQYGTDRKKIMDEARRIPRSMNPAIRAE